MADGPVIQRAGQRALAAGITLTKTLGLVRRFRARDGETPLVLMGYYNPIYIYGVERFLADALEVGLDGMIVVDLPPEEDAELCRPALDAGLSFVRLTAPTTDEARLPAVLTNTSGFVYYISITGITGAAGAASGATQKAVERLRRHTTLPIAVGFGIKTPDQAAEVARGGGRCGCRFSARRGDRRGVGLQTAGQRPPAAITRSRWCVRLARACARRDRRLHRELARSILTSQGKRPVSQARHPARPVGEVRPVRADDFSPRA